MPLSTAINYWKLGNASELADLINSANFNWLGSSSYQAAKFGNGSYNSTVANAIVASEAGEFNADLMMVDYWTKTDYRVINGYSADGQRHADFTWLRNANNRITIDTLEIGLATRFISRINGAFNIFTITTGFSWNALSLNYCLWCLNRSGIAGGADKRRCYLNGNLIAQSTVNLNAMAGSGSGQYEFLNGTLIGVSNWQYDGIIDDAIIYNNTTQIATANANRNIEGRAIAGRPFLNRFNRVKGIGAGL